MCTPHLESKFQSDKQNWFVYVFSYSVSNYISNFIQILQDKKYCNFSGVRSDLLLNIVYGLVFFLTDSEMGYVHVFAGSQVRRPVTYLQITNIFLFDKFHMK